MTNVLPRELDTNLNQPVISYLAGKSAHSDTASAFIDAVSKTPTGQCFSPMDRDYSYILGYANQIIFGFVTGMQSIHVRLPDSFAHDVLERGALTSFLPGNNWYELPMWSGSLSFDAEVDYLVQSAYDYAIQGESDDA